ncbi:hypothetical protein TSOC_002872 [Tetrabaena socialis]|uniref:Protein kinase domain-containing protein n=1 Tax=Tetrabaena socialis TaxID=47790 RepID=A0A2J8AD22_9CHLO|nr:hypothetical protein TSOC_002872 [Tetrabaena socialis]|eukprot:PNH10412.1 hypothetical protein TSOC_002872 [Tetrabaena socialis]
MRRRMQGSLLGENAEYVVEVKGPGSVIGEMGLGLGDSSSSPSHRVSARARGHVTVVKLTEENFFKALLQMYGGQGGGGGSTVSGLTASSVSEALGSPTPHCPGQVISAGHLSAKADVWSFGLMLLELFYGCTMQTIRSLHDTVQCGLRQGGPLAAGLPQARSIEETVIEEMFKSPYLSYARMAAACLRADPRSRPTFDELAAFLQVILSIDQGIVGLYQLCAGDRVWL